MKRRSGSLFATAEDRRVHSFLLRDKGGTGARRPRRWRMEPSFWLPIRYGGGPPGPQHPSARQGGEMEPAVPGGGEWSRRSGSRFATAEDRRVHSFLLRDKGGNGARRPRRWRMKRRSGFLFATAEDRRVHSVLLRDKGRNGPRRPRRWRMKRRSGSLFATAEDRRVHSILFAKEKKRRLPAPPRKNTPSTNGVSSL
jgi:hypothetical protein